MFIYYLKIAFKTLWNNKRYSMINIFGFAFSLSIFLVIILYIFQERSFNRYHAKSDHIYRLVDTEKNRSDIDYRATDLIEEQFPEIKNSCYYQQLPYEYTISYNNEGFALDGLASTNAAFFKIFDVEFLKGNRNVPFDHLNSVIITESLSKVLFGNDDPIGKEFIVRGEYQVEVSAIIEDIPNNSSFKTNLILNAENDNFKFYFSCENCEDESTFRWLFNNYVEINPDANLDLLTASINENIESLSPFVNEVGLLPLVDIYLNDQTTGASTLRGNPGLLKLLMSIAGIILLLAIINYINLTLAQQSKRKKDIGIRKTIGASRNSLIYQFLSEATIVIIISSGLAAIIFELGYPFVKSLFGLPLKLSLLNPYIPAILLFIIVVGIATGLYPALSFSSFNPINLFGKALSSRESKSISRKSLTIFQFTVSISLIFCALVIWKQIDYSKNIDLGFNKDQLLRIKLPWPNDQGIMNQSKAFVDELRFNHNIQNVSASLGVPGEVGNYMGSGVEDKDFSLAIIYCDSTFLKTLDIKLLEGRTFLSGDLGKSCLFNKTAMELFEWDNIENKRYENGGGFDVIGVVEDFHINSSHKEIGPMAIIYSQDYITHASVKIPGEKVVETMDFIRESWKEHLSEFPLSYKFYDEWFDKMYEKEERFGKIINYFTILGIIISCIGILGLAIFNAERKTKEIGIRKVNGATTGNVVFLLTREYTAWVIIAFVISAPISFLIMNRWLQAFAFRTEITWWIFAISVIAALTIAWLSVIWHSLKAAIRNPVEALRYE